MIPSYARVAALDDNPDHLQKIVLGLARAGFCAFPLLFDAGKFEPTLSRIFPGMRLVFTDIHMGATGYTSNSKTWASTIIMGLKTVVDTGPYGLIFWSEFPGEVDGVWAEISDRAEDAGLVLPVCRGTIAKKDVLGVLEPSTEKFDAESLRDKIFKQLANFHTLKLAMAWDERVAEAAMRSTNRLYELATKDVSHEKKDSQWCDLLAYLAQEAVGKNQSIKTPTLALDNALLPLVEDQLFRQTTVSNDDDVSNNPIAKRLSSLSGNKKLELSPEIPAKTLNAHYLVDEATESSSTWERGMVTRLRKDFLSSPKFVGLFGCNADDLIDQEFAIGGSVDDEVKKQVTLHVVELGAECDHVQDKVKSHRYLLALQVPSLQMSKFFNDKKNRPANDSIWDIGEISFGQSADSFHLLISCRRFMVLPSKVQVDGSCKFRLRKAVVEELSHHYVTYLRRPGAMRFYKK